MGIAGVRSIANPLCYDQAMSKEIEKSASPMIAEGYLGLFVGVALVILLGSAWLFGSLAEDVTTNDSIVRFDSAVVNALHASSSPALVNLMLTISLVGNEIPQVITVGLVVLFIVRRRWIDLLLLVLAVGGAQIVNTLLKLIFNRARPVLIDPVTVGIGASFPSGHAMGALVFYGVCAYFLISRSNHWNERIIIFVIAVLVVMLVGFSRIYLGVHYPSDVLAGYSAGTVWLIGSILGVERFRWWRGHTYRVSQAGAASESQSRARDVTDPPG